LLLFGKFQKLPRHTMRLVCPFGLAKVYDAD